MTTASMMRCFATMLCLLLGIVLSTTGTVSAFTIICPTVHPINNSPSLPLPAIGSMARGYKIGGGKLPSNNGFYRNKNNVEGYKSTTATTSLKMGFNLPPGNKGPGDALGEILPGILTIGAVVLFLASPLGSIFFAITNSLFILALVTPIVLYVSFQIWNKVYAIDGTCPNCSAPLKVLKDESASPSMCISCGARVRATRDKDGVELCNDPSSVLQDDSVGSIFDTLFGGGGGDDVGGGGGGLFNDDAEVYTPGSQSQSKGNSASSKRDEAKRQGTIIDVDVTED